MAVARMMAQCRGLLMAMEFRGREWGDGRHRGGVRAEGDQRKTSRGLTVMLFNFFYFFAKHVIEKLPGHFVAFYYALRLDRH